MSNKLSRTIVLKVSGKQVDETFTGLRKVVTDLERELRKLTPGTEAFHRKAAELREAREHFNRVRNEINEVNNALDQTPSFLSKITKGMLDFGDVAKNIFSVNLFEKAFGKLSETATQLLEVSDAMADVQKTTGMASEEVKTLWDEFDKFNTRTSKMDLLKIAETAGRLGVAKEEMAEFVQEIDKAYVALGDSFDGGLEGVVSSLGKIKNLFAETRSQTYAEAINGVGSALNELAANGVSSENNIAQFALRIGALPEAIKPSLDNVLAMGAAFEESGVDAQIAASGYSNFMKVAGENLNSFAHSMNITVEEAQRLYNEKPEEFFLRFAEGMKGIDGDTTIKIMDSLKLKSLEVQKAVGAAANNVGKFRDSMKLSNEAMEEAKSLNQEFSTKNNNAAATWEKLTNAVSEFFTSTNMFETFEGLINALGWLTGVTREAGDGVKVFRERMVLAWQVLKYFIASLVGYQVGLKVSALLMSNLTRATIAKAIADKAQTIWIGIVNTLEATRAVVLALVTGNIKKAKNAMIAYNAVMKANPIGLVVSLLTVLAVVIYKFYTRATDATKAAKELSQAFKATSEEAAREVTELDKLYQAATDVTKSTKERTEAVNELRTLYPYYFKDLSDEIILNGKAEDSYNALKKSIVEAARARAAQSVIEQRTAQRLQEEEKLYKKIEADKEAIEKYKKRKDKGSQRIEGSGDDKGFTVDYDQSLKSSEQRLKQHEKELKELKEKYDKEDEYLKDIIAKNEQATQALKENERLKREAELEAYKNKEIPGSNRTASDQAKQRDEQRKKDLEKSKEAIEKAKKEELKALQELADEKLKMLTTNYENERAILLNENKKEIDAHTQHTEDIRKRIAELETLRDQAQSTEAKGNYNAALAHEQNALLNHQLKRVELEKTHQTQLAQLKEKYDLQQQKQEQDALQKALETKIAYQEEELLQVQTLEEAKAKLKEGGLLELNNKELRNVRTLEEAKKLLRIKAQREVIDWEIQSIEEQKQLLNDFIESNKEIISEEALQKLKTDLDELDKKLRSIRGEKQQYQESDQANKDTANREAKQQVDILGYSVADWEDMWANLDTTEGKIQALAMAVQGLNNVFQSFAKLQQAINEREIKTFEKNQQKKKDGLQQQLNEGKISQEQYQKGIQDMEEQTAEKKKEIQRRAAVAEKASNLASAVSNTALAVVKALAVAPPAGLMLAKLVGALGAVQIATIAAQPIPEFAQGGYTGAGTGKPDRTGFRPAGIVHEHEFVVPKWMLQNPVVADVVDWMESVRTGRTALGNRQEAVGRRQYAQGGYVSDTVHQSQSTNHQSSSDSYRNADPQSLIAVLSELKQVVTELKENGVEAYMVEDAENGKRIKRTIKAFERIENKNRIK